MFSDGAAVREVRAEASGDGGALLFATSTRVTVRNVSPTLALTGAGTVAEGAAYRLELGAITDPGDDTVTRWIVDWGDGTNFDL